MKLIYRRQTDAFPQTAVYGITFTKYAAVIALGLKSIVIELQKPTPPKTQKIEYCECKNPSPAFILGTQDWCLDCDRPRRWTYGK